MSQTLDMKRVRLAMDGSSFDLVKDAITANTPKIWKRSAVRFEIGAFLDLEGKAPATGDEVNISGWQSLTLEVKNTAGTGNLMAKTVTAFDATLTAATWSDLTKQHAAVEFTAAETNITAGSYDLVVYVIKTDGTTFTLGVSRLQVVDSKASFSADPAPENPGAAVSIEQGDARWSLIGHNHTGVYQPYAASLDALSVVPVSEFGAGLLVNGSASAMRYDLGVQIGIDVQPYSAALENLAVNANSVDLSGVDLTLGSLTFSDGASVLAELGLFAPIGASLAKTSNQPVASGGQVLITWQTTRWDDASFFDSTNNALVVPVTGRYEVSFTFVGDQSDWRSHIYKNGTYLLGLLRTSDTKTAASSSVELSLNAGDYLQVYLEHYFGSPQSITSAEGTRFTIRRTK